MAQVGPAIELGRSFIRREYQRTYSALMLLWNGIGRYVARHPECSHLFGPVSISSRVSPEQRGKIAAFLETRTAPERLRKLIPVREHVPFSGVLPEDLRQTGAPVLLRHYVNLGAKLLAFRTDPDFSNALDALMLVDLKETDRRLLSRYLGAEAANTFRIAA